MWEEIVKYIERCLYDFKANLTLIETLKEEKQNLMSLKGQSYDVHPINGMSDPVADITARVLLLENKIKRTEKKVKPVMKLYTHLKGSSIFFNQLREILEYRYFKAKDVSEVKRILGISAVTFWRRKMDLLKVAHKFFRDEY